ncbi:MAG: hypothetical protein AAGD47_09580 [Pseudomonadota bacterium]
MRWILILTLLGFVSPALACGGGQRCEIPGGYYLAQAPSQWDGVTPLPVVIFYHGWNASPEGMMKNAAMVRSINDRGALFVVPYAQTGYWRQIGAGRAEGGRDELAYTRALLADVTARWPVDQGRMLATGFSRGGSMVWNLACYAGDEFTAFVPIAGGFWNSTPADCPSGPINLRHIHGETDSVVAFDSIGIYNSMPIPEGMSVLRKLNGCGTDPDETSQGSRYECTNWNSCGSGRALSLCLHPMGHSIPAEWVGEAYDWMISLED